MAAFPDLMEVSVSSNKHFVSIDDSLYTKDKKQLILWLNAKSFDDVVLPESIVHIGSSAFYICDNLKKIIFLGTMEQWNNISISSGNNILTSGNIEISVQTN